MFFCFLRQDLVIDPLIPFGKASNYRIGNLMHVLLLFASRLGNLVSSLCSPDPIRLYFVTGQVDLDLFVGLSAWSEDSSYFFSSFINKF